METVTLENPLDIDLRRLAAKTFAEYAQLLVDEDSLDQATQALARAQTHAEVVQKQNAKDVLNLGALSSIHRNRGKVLGKQGKLDQAQRELLTALAIDERIASEGAVYRYDLACSLAQCCAVAVRLGALADAERYAGRALIELRSAWDQGWKDLKGIERDPDLDALRDRSEFRAFLQSKGGSADNRKP